VDPGWLGPVAAAGTVAGTVGCAELPQLRGVPVAAGGADHVAGALAAGLVTSGDVVVELGGAGNILVRSAEPIVDDRLFLDYHLVPGAFAPNGCMAATGSLVRWFQREIGGGASLADLDAAQPDTTISFQSPPLMLRLFPLAWPGPWSPM
jgi:xylulokinase